VIFVPESGQLKSNVNTNVFGESIEDAKAVTRELSLLDLDPSEVPTFDIYELSFFEECAAAPQLVFADREIQVVEDVMNDFQIQGIWPPMRK
jgi:hypothetical protein